MVGRQLSFVKNILQDLEIYVYNITEMRRGTYFM